MAKLRTAWEWSAAAIDAVLVYYLRAVNPRYVVTLFVVANAVQTAAHFFGTTSWSDFYTASGYWVTVTGFLVAISELYRARTSAEQIRDALIRGATGQRRKGDRYFGERSRTMLALARTHVDSYEWQLAVVRLTEMIEALTQISAISPDRADRRARTVADLHRWITTFDGGVTGRRLQYDAAAWLTFALAAESELNKDLMTVHTAGGADDGA